MYTVHMCPLVPHQVVPMHVLESDDDFMEYVINSNNRSVCVCVRVCVCECMRVCERVCSVSAYACVCICTHTYVCTYMCTHLAMCHAMYRNIARSSLCAVSVSSSVLL